MIKIHQVTLDDIDHIASIFDAYRVFYRQPSDIPGASNFLSGLLKREDAIIYMARLDDAIAGFTLVYPSYSSVGMAPVLVLNDLYVHADHRRHGVASALLAHVVKLGRSKKALRLHLETEITNSQAQQLYEQEGWVKEGDTYHYNYTL
jgi:Acetyltransferases